MPPNQVADPILTPVSGEHRESKPWVPEEDAILLDARQRGLNWAPIAAQYFPIKSANACRKRHERLIAKSTTTGDWDSTKVEALAQSYMELREEMWKMLAAKLDEKWEIVEKKVISLLGYSICVDFLTNMLIVHGKGPQNPEKPWPHRQTEAQE